MTPATSSITPRTGRLDQRWPVRLARLLAGSLGLVALVTLPVISWGNNGFTLGNYFSYFTIWSNVLAVVVLFAGALFAPGSTGFTWLRGLTTTAMVTTAIVYALLLADIDVNLNTPWINNTLHVVMPVLILIDWIVVRPKHLPARSWLTWLGLPFAYCVYTLIRGSQVDWYPYPFIDPRGQSVAELVGSLLLLTVAMAVIAGAVHLVGRARSATVSSAQPSR